MIEIRIEGKSLDLPDKFSMGIEDSSPIYNDRGSQSIPATVPATHANKRLLAFPTRADSGSDPNSPQKVVEVADGGYLRRGVLNVTEASVKSGITFNIGFDNATAYMAWKDKKLTDLKMPVYYPVEQEGNTRQEWLLDDLFRLYRESRPQEDDMAVFPVAVSKEDGGTGDDKEVYWEILNIPGEHGLDTPSTVRRVIDGEVTEVTVPTGYCVSPFLRVWRLLELLFDDLGLVLEANPFREDVELARLVVLNNAADAACRGWIEYSDIVPDCTVETFLNALWVRFGLVYDINYYKGTVSLKLIKDVIRANAGLSLLPLSTGPEVMGYETPQYVKLSASTSIDGASPSSDRFEDFARGLDLSQVRLGNHVSQWIISEGDNSHWEGDIRDRWAELDPDEPDPDVPDPDEPDPDYPDAPDYYSLRTVRDGRSSSSGSSQAGVIGSTVAREFVTGTWYRLDSSNGKVKESSSGFFNWDPQPSGMSPLELSSEDEWVPVGYVSNVGTGTGNAFNDLCPMYLVGSRHYHSYIRGNDNAGDTNDGTPLAFMFAYTVNKKTVGRINPESETGLPLCPDDGTEATLSLLFQFKDGLFARFWKEYDEILRHGNRTIDVNVRLDKIQISRLDMLVPCSYRGIRCLIDTASYSLPALRALSVDLKLRTLSTQGEYDIEDEQSIPDFSAGYRTLEYVLVSDNLDEMAGDSATREAAVKKFKADTGYTDHGEQGDAYLVGPISLSLDKIVRVMPTWDYDPGLPPPPQPGAQVIRTYTAMLHYSVREVHDMATDPDDLGDWEYVEPPLGTVILPVEYRVILTTRLVNA